jgi:hypothetical protein
MSKAAAVVPAAYRGIIAERLWGTAGLSAAYNDWKNADRSSALALRLAPDAAIPGSAWFRWLAARMPRAALRLRERLIRLLRPSARSGPAYQRIPVFKEDA